MLDDTFARKHQFQNVNPERGRKQDAPQALHHSRRRISEREPRKGTETPFVGREYHVTRGLISEREPRKGTETRAALEMKIKSCKYISEREPRKGTEQAMISY